MNAIGSGIASLASSGPARPPCTPSPIEIGMQIFNDKLTSDPNKRIGKASTSTNHNIPCTLDELLNETLKFKESRNSRRSVARKRVEGVLLAINEHAKAIDVLIQQQPDITALVWGGIRFLIGVAAKEAEIAGHISDAVEEILKSLGRWNRYIELFQNFQRVREAASLLFSQVINFLVRATRHYKTRWVVRFGKAVFPTKLENIMKEVRNHARVLGHEVTLASEIQLENDRKAYAKQQIREEEEFKRQEEFRSVLSTRVTENHYLTEDIASSVKDTKSNLKSAINSLEQMALDRKLDKILQWLRQRQLGASPFLPQVEEGTCLWVQQHETYIEWRNGSSNRPLCICGPPGSGKSAIASHLIATATEGITAAYFFQSFTNRDQLRPICLVAAILAELLEMEKVRLLPRYYSIIGRMEALSSSLRRLDENFSFQLLWSLFIEVVNDLTNFTLIVDGLDECDNLFRDEFCVKLLGLSSLSNARVIILFRHHPKLNRLLEDSFQIELTPAMVEKDILLYVTREIDRHAEELLWLQEEIIDTVKKSSQGMFLWAEMLLISLKSATTQIEQLSCLESCPPGLDEFYRMVCPNPGPNLSLQREIFLVLLGVLRALTCEEISDMLALNVDEEQVDELCKLIEPEQDLVRLCWPLVRLSRKYSHTYVHLMHTSVKDFLVQSPSKCSHSLNMTFDDSDAYLARKCLAALSLENYRSPNTIAILIRRNVASTTEEDEDKYFHQYAATHWYIHLTSLKYPGLELVQQAARFLNGNEFVSWSEYIFQLTGSQGLILEVLAKLKLWLNDLPPDLKKALLLDQYFVKPYYSVANIFREDGGDKTLPYLCLFQLGEFYNLSGRIEEAFDVKGQVAKGLVSLLGEKHPLALKAESAYALEFLGQGHFREAEQSFARLAEIQRDVLGTDQPDYYQSLQRQGMAEIWMTKYAEADLNLSTSLSGFIRIVGPYDFLSLLSQQSLGCVWEGQGELRKATLEYEKVWTYRKSVLGPDNPMAVWSRCAMVSTYRKLGRYKEAAIAIEEVIDARTRTMGVKAETTVDALIQRLVLLRESNKQEEAMELIDFISDGGLADEWFERVCQVDHIRGLIESDSGDLESARKTLQSLLDQASAIGVGGRNRSLLWVSLDLAVILRKQNKGDEALMLFDDIVVSIDSKSGLSWEKVLTPIELRIAEEALRLVRDIKTQDADMLLEKNGLRWVRLEDFWMQTGGPAADTAWMRGP